MKRNWRLILLTVLGLTILVLGIFIVANQAQISKNDSLGKEGLITSIKEYQVKAEFNQKALAELLNIAEKAKYNWGALKTAADILVKVSFNTLTIMEIAQIAGNAEHEVRYLDDLFEITIIYGGEHDNLVNLAKQAVNNEISEADLLATITYYRNNSQVKTIDEAVKWNNNAIDSATKKIEEVIQNIEQQNSSQPQAQINSKNNQLIKAIQGYMSNGHGNQSLTELLKIAAKTEYNHSVIKTAAYFLSQEGSFNDWTVLSIAKLAGGAGREIKQLNDLLEVSITYGGDSLTIIELAIKAIKNEISEAELENRIAYYRNNADSKTIDEALENNKKAMAGF